MVYVHTLTSPTQTSPWNRVQSNKFIVHHRNTTSLSNPQVLIHHEREQGNKSTPLDKQHSSHSFLIGRACAASNQQRTNMRQLIDELVSLLSFPLSISFSPTPTNDARHTFHFLLVCNMRVSICVLEIKKFIIGQYKVSSFGMQSFQSKSFRHWSKSL